MFKNYRLRDYDFKLIILVLALSAVGIMTIGSAEPASRAGRWQELLPAW